MQFDSNIHQRRIEEAWLAHQAYFSSKGVTQQPGAIIVSFDNPHEQQELTMALHRAVLALHETLTTLEGEVKQPNRHNQAAGILAQSYFFTANMGIDRVGTDWPTFIPKLQKLYDLVGCNDTERLVVAYWLVQAHVSCAEDMLNRVQNQPFSPINPVVIRAHLDASRRIMVEAELIRHPGYSKLNLQRETAEVLFRFGNTPRSPKKDKPWYKFW